MSIFRAQTLKLRGWAPKAGWLAWRNYDFQLTTYAILLTLFGLAMAYSNSIDTSHEGLSVGSPFVRTMMWAVIAAVVLGLTTVFVTHDQEEALELGDLVAVMNQGRIEQIGAPDTVLNNPATPFVAEFLEGVRPARAKATLALVTDARPAQR